MPKKVGGIIFVKGYEVRMEIVLVGFDDFFIYEELARELHERRVGITQLIKDESKAFSMWSECQKKVHY